MDIFFADPLEVPLPPAEVRIRELKAEPWPDGKRLRVYLEVEPFQKKPNADLTVFDSEGRELSSAYIIESMTRKIELVMHLRGAAQGVCTLHAVLFYASLPEPGAEGATAEIKVERQMVDTRQVSFEIFG